VTKIIDAGSIAGWREVTREVMKKGKASRIKIPDGIYRKVRLGGVRSKSDRG
jgi:hypothetical protein